MNISIASINPIIGSKEKNITKMIKYIKNSSAELIVFGEMTLTGYPCKDELSTLAESIHGPSTQKLKEIAKQTKKYIIFGMPLKDTSIKGILYNAAILIHPDEKINSYNKWFLPTFGPFEEKIFFDEGETLPVFDTTFGKIGICICYDIYFPEIAKAFSLQGADIIVCISASPSVTRPYFEKILPVRSIENTVFTIYANIVGNQEDLVFWGGSQAYDPLGNQMVKAAYFEESMVTFPLNLSDINRSRANRPVIRDIRSAIYTDLYKLSRYHTKK